MKKMLLVIVVLIVLTLSACDDFRRNVDDVIYDTTCRDRQRDITIVVLPEEDQTKDIVETEISIGIYNDKEYYFESITVYDYYLIQLNGYKGDYLPILEAIEEDSYSLEFLVDVCIGSPVIQEDIKSRDVE